MRQQRQREKTSKRLVNGYTIVKIGRARWQVVISGQKISGTLSYCTSAAYQAKNGETQ